MAAGWKLHTDQRAIHRLEPRRLAVDAGIPARIPGLGGNKPAGALRGNHLPAVFLCENGCWSWWHWLLTRGYTCPSNALMPGEVGIAHFSCTAGPDAVRHPGS